MTLEDLQRHLQTAIEIEWSTIPPYLCARWSLVEERNTLAATCIEDVVMEEMLHLTLACNLLNAVGGSPRLIPPGPDSVPPRYPTYLPHSNDAFLVNLLPFSAEALETFLAIERPERRDAPPEPDRYHTIAQFYAAVRDEIEQLGRKIFTGPVTLQVDSSYYYGSGEAFPITDLASAEKALDLIVDEGEGIHDSIWDGDHQLVGQGKELAHYFRFNELHLGRRYVEGDTPKSGPTGEPILIDYSSVLPMKPNPKAADYPDGSGLRAMTEECNATYSRLLTELQAAFTGHPAMLVNSVQTMMRLRYQAIALMQVPVGDQGLTAGPAFEWRGSAPSV